MLFSEALCGAKLAAGVAVLQAVAAGLVAGAAVPWAMAAKAEVPVPASRAGVEQSPVGRRAWEVAAATAPGAALLATVAEKLQNTHFRRFL